MTKWLLNKEIFGDMIDKNGVIHGDW